MNVLTDEQWGKIVDFPMWSGDLWDCRFCAEWMVKLLTAKHELRILDETGCLDSVLL